MEKIGIDEEERVTRGLGFHSFRHLWVTRTSAVGVPLALQSQFTEHADERTRKRYEHLEASDKLWVMPIQTAIAGGLK